MHKRSRDHVNERGNVLQEKEIVSLSAAAENLKMQLGKSRYSSLKAKNWPPWKELPDSSRKKNYYVRGKCGISESRNIVTGLQLRGKNQLSQSSCQTFAPEREDDLAKDSVVHLTEKQEASSLTYRDRCTQLRSGGKTTKKGHGNAHDYLASEQLACKDELTAENKDDKQFDRKLFDRQILTVSDKTVITKRKENDEGPFSKIKKLVHGRKDCGELTSRKQAEDNVVETKVNIVSSAVGRLF